MASVTWPGSVGKSRNRSQHLPTQEPIRERPSTPIHIADRGSRQIGDTHAQSEAWTHPSLATRRHRRGSRWSDAVCRTGVGRLRHQLVSHRWPPSHFGRDPEPFPSPTRCHTGRIAMAAGRFRRRAHRQPGRVAASRRTRVARGRGTRISTTSEWMPSSAATPPQAVPPSSAPRKNSTWYALPPNRRAPR